jgi:microsomal dipeptidase-like Zn-dependent dipeptidase
LRRGKLAQLILVAAAMQCVSAASAELQSSCEGPVIRGPIDGTNGSMVGFADYHAHMFSEYAFGQYLFHGHGYPSVDAPPEQQLADALGSVRHGDLRHTKTALGVRYIERAHGTRGYPTFADWPNYWMLLHQQMYVDWVYRAYRHGLRLMVMTITHSRTLCEKVHRTDGAPCSDEEVIAAQIDATRRMLDGIAEHEGGWMRLARSSQEAAEIIRENRLALVLGVEVDTLFGCGSEGDASCRSASYAPELDRMYRAGVRHIIPIHLIDNGFGGAAIYDDHMNVNQLYLRNTLMSPDPAGCKDERVDFEFSESVSTLWTAMISMGRLYWPRYPLSAKGKEGHCNARGLTRDGEELVGDLMRRGMLIDLEHMSERSMERTVELARANCADLEDGHTCYPLLSSHSWPRDLKRRLRDGEKVGFVRPGEVIEATTELQKSRAAVAAIRDLGGVVGVITNQGRLYREDGSIADECPTSSESVATALTYAVEQMGGKGGVGFGTDFNGFAGQPGPRFGEHACGDRGAQDSRAPLSYPFADQFGEMTPCTRAGERDFDFNRDGLAPLWPAAGPDRGHEGGRGSGEVIDTVFSSARAYVEMWERAEEVARAGTNNTVPAGAAPGPASGAGTGVPAP